MSAFARRDGVLVEAVGRFWAAFSPASGQTVLLNNEMAAILEVLESSPATSIEVANTLSRESGAPAASVAAAVDFSWETLIQAGLVAALGDKLTPP